jgi:predicted kinase
MVLVRGLPGSGKSFLAAEKQRDYERRQGRGRAVVLSTDDFFVDRKTGEYKYRAEEIDRAHKWNIAEAHKACEAAVPLILVANTFTRRCEARPYLEIAQRFGYDFEVAQPSTEWAWDVRELAARNIHRVPAVVIQKMLNRWEVDFSAARILSDSDQVAR